jgi:hypothetical protein
MASVAYQVVPDPDGWHVECAGVRSGPYSSVRAAFEAAVADARKRQAAGYRVQVYVRRDAEGSSQGPTG